MTDLTTEHKLLCDVAAVKAHLDKYSRIEQRTLLGRVMDHLNAVVKSQREPPPRYLTGCLRDGVCRGVCENTDCPNHDMVVAARVCVEPKEAEIMYPATEGMK